MFVSCLVHGLWTEDGVVRSAVLEDVHLLLHRFELNSPEPQNALCAQLIKGPASLPVRLSLRHVAGLLPARLTELDLAFNRVADASGLPTGLTALDLRGNRLRSAAGLPTGLRTLDLHSNRLAAVRGLLPTGLRTLDLSWNRIADAAGLGVLPPGLAELDLSGNAGA